MVQVAADPRYVPQYELHMGRARNDAARAFGRAITGPVSYTHLEDWNSSGGTVRLQTPSRRSFASGLRAR